MQRLGDAVERLGREEYDVVLSDLRLPDSHGLDTLMRLRGEAPEVAIVVLTGFEDDKLALKAAQAGAQDYLAKTQVDTKLIARTLRYAIERKRAEASCRGPERPLRPLAAPRASSSPT